MTKALFIRFLKENGIYYLVNQGIRDYYDGKKLRDWLTQNREIERNFFDKSYAWNARPEGFDALYLIQVKFALLSLFVSINQVPQDRGLIFVTYRYLINSLQHRSRQSRTNTKVRIIGDLVKELIGEDLEHNSDISVEQFLHDLISRIEQQQ